jgi:hypothetical protein
MSGLGSGHDTIVPGIFACQVTNTVRILSFSFFLFFASALSGFRADHWPAPPTPCPDSALAKACFRTQMSGFSSQKDLALRQKIAQFVRIPAPGSHGTFLGPSSGRPVVVSIKIDTPCV